VTRVFAGGRACAVVGHRGGRGEGWPSENTLEAFARAHAEGADAIELDVRTCVGNHIVVMHDPDLARMTGGNDRREVARLTRGELARVALGAGKEHVPLLDDVLDWARDRLAVNIEAKHDVPDRAALARSLARTVARHPQVEVIVSSFDPASLAMLAVSAPRVPRAWLTHAGQQPWQSTWSWLARRAPIAAVHLERVQASPRAVAALHRANRLVGVWTVNDAAEARDLAALGVDWLITDSPEAIRTAIRR
jgi:glycerophosphoryl diester phosphodiesterase